MTGDSVWATFSINSIDSSLNVKKPPDGSKGLIKTCFACLTLSTNLIHDCEVFDLKQDELASTKKNPTV